MTDQNLPCPHGRPSWKGCPHCLWLNNLKPIQEFVDHSTYSDHDPRETTDYKLGLKDALTKVIEATEKARKRTVIETEHGKYEFSSTYIDADLFISELKKLL